MFTDNISVPYCHELPNFRESQSFGGCSHDAFTGSNCHVTLTHAPMKTHSVNDPLSMFDVQCTYKFKKMKF